LVKVDSGVGCDLRTWEGVLTVDGTIEIYRDHGNKLHVKVASCVEFDSHVFPKGSGVGVSNPSNEASRACIVDGSRTWYGWLDVCAYEERHGQSEERDESVCGEHSLFTGGKRSS